MCLTLGLAAPAGAAAAPACVPARARHVHGTERAATFRLPGRALPVGCVGRHRFGFSLGSGGYEEQVYVERFAGRFVEFSRAETVDEGTWYSTVVQDLARGARLDVGGDVDDLVLAPSGAFAWIEPTSAFRVPGYEVHRSDGRLLAGAYDIEPGSLERHGRRINWMQGGEERHAGIGRPPAPGRQQAKRVRLSRFGRTA